MNIEKKVLLTIFGATGDLAKRKLYPSLFGLFKKGILREHFAVIGTARRPWEHETLREVVLESIKDDVENEEFAEKFASHFYYQPHDVQDSEHYRTLKQLGDTLEERYQTEGNQVFYLAMSPNFFGTIALHLKSENIVTEHGYSRLIIEKPFGTDLETATELNEALSNTFTEEQIYRIDHYLGKEMIQNVSAIRFANIIFESIWNKDYIDNIQITFAEAIGVEDRGGYYDGSGALRDMVQNHILQVLSLLAMEPPKKFAEEEIRKEKIKAFQAIHKYTEDEALRYFIPGQYTAGEINNERFIGYREEPNVPEDSLTETFVAGAFFIDNERWDGVPFYIRTGKRLVEKGTRINVVFKTSPQLLTSEECGTNVEPNVLTIYIQPTEGFSLSLNGKEMGQDFNLSPVALSYRHDSEFLGNSPEAYEKLLHDTLDGNSSNFSHWEEVKRSWELIDVIKKAWTNHHTELYTYPARTMGPMESYELLERNGHEWIWQPEKWYIERKQLRCDF
ncbi:MAG: glucose-6-phosphate dehydrogenase [Streptococcaceae bacterium]|nr:glucose-6-phosphate dehydrogenase [Streptococcaceae bacterium]